jgi:hypothetical protein
MPISERNQAAAIHCVENLGPNPTLASMSRPDSGLAIVTTSAPYGYQCCQGCGCHGGCHGGAGCHGGGPFQSRLWSQASASRWWSSWQTPPSQLKPQPGSQKSPGHQ